MAVFIQTPRGFVTTNRNGKAELGWDTRVGQKGLTRYSEAQKFVDGEVLRLCDPYIPLRTGVLIKSGILGTEVGSGTVRWIAPYARRQYYSPRQPGSQTGPLRGPYWFERMKAVHVKTILAGAQRLLGGG